MNLKGKIQFYGITDIGRVRKQNEDAISFDNNIALAVLADGMGGHRGGEIASAITVSTVLNVITDKIKNTNNTDAVDNGIYSTESQLILEALKLANKNVYDSSQANEQYRGMGTTVVVVLFYDNRFTVAHVGDSRLYRLRNGKLEQLTRDHSYVQEQIDQGIVTPEQARNSKNKNRITRAIGIDSTVKIDIQEDVAVLNDIYLLCSDGVTDMIEDHLIRSALIENSQNLEQASEEIIRLSNKHGGKDNISALLVKPVKPFPAENSFVSRLFGIFSK